ncbi:MAG: TonB-dependent receptor [Daejeonella sp.]|nr:TonB-dependent receptor [Daejeonella sp.]
MLFLFTGLSSSYAQTTSVNGQIAGKVTDEKQSPLAYATVTLLNAKDSSVLKGSLTSEIGKFIYSNLAPGSYLVSITNIGYEPVVKGPFHIKSEELIAVGDIHVKRTLHQLNTVNISSKRPLIEYQIDKTVVNVESSALATGNSALEILQKSPGVAIDKSGNISLRGKQGVTVMLDGKRTYLSPEQLSTFLSSTEGTSIQAIELITNPSSKYDAAGSSGIINIKMKKNRQFGTNGAITAGSGYGRYYKSFAGLNLNYRQKSVNIFGNINGSDNKTAEDLTVFRVNNAGGNQTYFNQFSRSTRVSKNINYKAGLDYSIDKNNTIGFALNGYNNNGNLNTANATLIGSTPAKIDSSVMANNPGRSRFKSIAYDLNFKSTIDSLGRELTADVDYSKFSNSVSNNYNNTFIDNTSNVFKSSSVFRSFAPTNIKVWSGKVDYVVPLDPKTKLEIGVKSSFVSTDNDFRFENRIGNSFDNDTSRSNHFAYNENIHAAYINFRKEFKATTIQFGLRGEQTNSEGNSITLGTAVDRHYLNLFPTFYISQSLSKDNDLGFSYSRRVDRPDYESLNPFVYFIDLYTFSAGNPFLSPQYTNSFELFYTYKKKLNVGLAYSHTRNVITQVIVTDTVHKTLYQTTQNLARQDFYSSNINYPIVITNWWNTYNNLTLYYNYFKSPNLIGAPYQSGKLAYQLNTNQSFTVNTSTTVELSGNYQSSQVYGTYLIKPMYGVDLGINKSFAQRRANIKLSANDIFNLRKTQISSAIATQNYRLDEKPETRIIRLSFTYRFGDNQIKGANERARGSSSEERRVRSGG